MPIEVPCIRRLKTSLGNPGDIFIAEGLEYLFEKEHDIKWLYLDKFNQKNFLDTIGRSSTKAIVYAGTPQYNNYDYWSFWYDTDFWHFARDNKYRVAALAGGSGYPDPHMLPEQFSQDCLRSKLTRDILNVRKLNSDLVTTRDPHSHTLLNDFGIQNSLLPCSASWLYKQYQPDSLEMEDYWVLTPCGWNAVPDVCFVDCRNKPAETVAYFKRIYNLLKARLSNVLICLHSKREYDYYKEYFPAGCLFYSESWRELMVFYSKAKGVVSGRLHGALPLITLPGRKIHLIAVDTRHSATNFFSSISKSVYSDPPGYIVDKFLGGADNSGKDLDKFEQEYVSLISTYLENFRVSVPS